MTWSDWWGHIAAGHMVCWVASWLVAGIMSGITYKAMAHKTKWSMVAFTVISGPVFFVFGLTVFLWMLWKLIERAMDS